MSRAYRIKVRESLRTVIRADDHISTQLEMLDILPEDQMAELLGMELERRGFQREGDKLIREADGVTVEVDPATATVTVRAEAEKQVELERELNSWGDLDWGRTARKQAEEELRKEAMKDLDRQAARQAESLQNAATELLEGKLADLRRELDEAVNRVTAEALKRKASQMGEIKEISEDAERGSLTIVVEV